MAEAPQKGHQGERRGAWPPRRTPNFCANPFQRAGREAVESRAVPEDAVDPEIGDDEAPRAPVGEGGPMSPPEGFSATCALRRSRSRGLSWGKAAKTARAPSSGPLSKGEPMGGPAEILDRGQSPAGWPRWPGSAFQMGSPAAARGSRPTVQDRGERPGAAMPARKRAPLTCRAAVRPARTAEGGEGAGTRRRWRSRNRGRGRRPRE